MMWQRLATLFVALAVRGASAAQGGDPTKDYKSIPMESPMNKGELDALTQAAGSDRLEGMVVSDRKVAPDGKSGMLQFSNPNAQQERWSPSFSATPRDLAKTVENEDLVLAYFFSSHEDELSQSHTSGKEFEIAARELLESDDQVTLAMVDVHRHPEAFDGAEFDFNLKKAHEVKLFKAGRPSDYEGPTSAKGIVAYMQSRAGPPYRKVESSAALDELVASASTLGTTVVVGVFSAGYEGSTSRSAFEKAAVELRDPMRLAFVEVGVRAANGAALFASDTPFNDVATNAYAIVRPAYYLGKAESRYTHSENFRKLYSTIQAHAFPTVYPLSPTFIAHSKKYGKRFLATLLYPRKAMEKKHRYILKQLHKLIEAHPAFNETYAFALAEAKPLDPWLAERFDRTTINGKFFGNFEQDYPMRDFTLIVSELSSERNWLSTELAGSTPDALEPLHLVTFLSQIAAGDLPELPQKGAAAAAAGLKEMTMGFGPGGTTGGFGDEPAKKKKKKKGKKGKVAKDEV